MRNICKISFLLLLIFNSSFSQEIEWQNTIGGSDKDELYSIQPTFDGGYIMGGHSKSGISGNKSESCLGGWDYWVVKTDAFGNVQWENTYGGFSDDWLYSVKQTTDGGYIFGGYSGSNISADKTENCLGGYDYWIIKTDASGNIQWDNTIGGSGSDYLISMEQTTDGGYILGGYSGSNISGDKSENSVNLNTYYDYWIVKIDDLGIVQWQNTIGGSAFEFLTSIQQTTDGGYIVGGYSGSNISGDKTEVSFGKDYWIVKTDSLGNLQWQNTIGGLSDDYLYSVIQTIDGGYLLGGSSLSSASLDKTEFNLGMHDFWIIKTDEFGNIQWQNTIGGNLRDELYSVKETNDGGFILCGASESSISGDKTENSLGAFDFWFVETNSVGDVQWQNTIGGSLDDKAISIHQLNDDSYIVGGYSMSDATGDKTQDCIGSNVLNDYWIMKITDKYNFIEGRLFADFDSDGIQDIGEPPLLQKKVTEESTGRFTFTVQDGHYSLVVDSGNFNVSPQSLNWYNSSPTLHTATFPSFYQTDSLNDFAFQPQGSFEDVCIKITPLGNFRSGFTASYMITYGNYGTTIVTPTVYFYPYTNVTYQSATLTPNAVTPDSVVWNLSALAPFQTGNIIVTVNVDLGLPIGTLINSSAHIEPYLTDDNPSCNNSNWEVYTTGSFDPNDILVSEDTLTTTQLSNAPWLDYIVRFQNTGNDTAFTVKILNPIDTNKLNISTFEFERSSHQVNLKWLYNKQSMEYKFENILLPDSNTNETLSHGFVRYRIQPKTKLNAGVLIPNHASIYFDFNEPVITNTAKTIIIPPPPVITSDTSTQAEFFVFPNPTSNTINISGIPLENGKAQLLLMDIYGKLILEKTITSITTTLETDNLEEGIYLIQSGGSKAKFVKL